MLPTKPLRLLQLTANLTVLHIESHLKQVSFSKTETALVFFAIIIGGTLPQRDAGGQHKQPANQPTGASHGFFHVNRGLAPSG